MVKHTSKALGRNLRAEGLREVAKKRKKIISDLKRDDQFLIARERIWRDLDAALKSANKKSDAIRFFQVFPGCSVALVPLIREFLGSLQDKDLGKVLWNYVKFSLRYGVDFVLSRTGSKGRFKLETTYPEPKADSFQAKLVHGKFEKVISESRWRGIRIRSFEIPVEEVPKYCQHQVIQGEARYFRIDDRWLESPLTDIERLAYDSDKVVFIEHRAELPYLFMLIGGKVSKEILRRAEKTITKFQKTRMKSRLAGRKTSPKTLKKLKKLLTASRKMGIPGKELAFTISPGLNLQSTQNFVSRTKKLLT